MIFHRVSFRICGVFFAALACIQAVENEAVSLQEELDRPGWRMEPIPEELSDQDVPVVTPSASSMPAISDSAPASVAQPANQEPVRRAELPDPEIGPPEGAEGEDSRPMMKPFSFLSSVLSEFFSLDEVGTASSTPDKFALSLGPRVGYDSNVLYAPDNPTSSYTSGVSGSARYNFGSPRWNLKTQLDAGVTYYDNRPGDATDTNVDFSLSSNYKVNRRFTIDFATHSAYLAQPEPQLVGSVSRFSGDYWYTDNAIDLQYSLRPRLAVRGGYRFSGYRYTEEQINQFLGYYSQTFILGLDYLLTPRTTTSIEYRFNPVSYYESDLGSEGQIVTVGFQHVFSPRLSWALQLGGEDRRLTKPALDGPSEYFGPFFETTAVYSYATNSAINLNIRYGTEPSGISGVSIRETLRGSLGIQHAFTGRLSGTATLFYEHDHYDQPGINTDFDQEIFSGTLGLRYLINRGIAIRIDYNYLNLTSDIQLNQYERTLMSVGVDVIF